MQIRTDRRRTAGLLLLVLTPVLASSAWAAKQVGEAEYARGAATAQTTGADPRILGKGTPLFEGDVITTGSKSFAVVGFEDGTRMTLRPGTTFSVESYNNSNDSNAGAVLKLFRGGLRAITGLISKRNSKGFKLNTPVSTIGIRGTEFDARLCEQDCAEEQKQLADSAGGSAAVARVAFLRGRMEARDSAGNSRPVARNGAVFEGETLETGGQGAAVLAFRDKSRITLRANTEFVVEEARYNPAVSSDNSLVMRLVKGGLRALSGLIGQSEPARYRMNTPVATVGIRGTGYDLVCQGSCASPSTASLDPLPEHPLDKLVSWIIKPGYAQDLTADGMFAHVWQGLIELLMDSGAVAVSEGQTAFVVNTATQPIILDQIPAIIRNITEPRPDELEIDFDSLFFDAGLPAAGLYVSVDDGIVSLNNQLDLNPGQAGYQRDAQTPPVQLAGTPGFMRNDPFPRPDEVDERFQELLEVFGLDQGQGGDSLECKI